MNFQPTNPYVSTTHRYTGQFDVKLSIQQRLLRAEHEDSKYCAVLYKMQRTMAVKYNESTDMFSLDDKAIIPVGEPEMPVSTGVRIHHGSLRSTAQNLGALDHDFHLFGLVPSVALFVDIPDSASDSFYRGQAHVLLKDKILQPSSPFRHAAELISIIRSQYSEDGVNARKPILMLYTDGGPDHRTNYISVKLSALVIFIALNLDLYVHCRTAPAQSYRYPAERVMSSLNLALQNVALQRNAIPNETVETRVKNLCTMKKLRAAATNQPGFGTALSLSIQPVLKLLENRFSRITYAGKKLAVHDPAITDDISEICDDMIKLIDDNIKGVSKGGIKKPTEKLQKFITRHCLERNYSFQVKKCNQEKIGDCAYCSINPPQLEDFDEVHFLPDPMPNGDHYKPFDEVYGTSTTDEHRPSLLGKIKKPEADVLNRNLLVAAKVRGYIMCAECGRRRVVYSGAKLNHKNELLVQIVQNEMIYTCGSALLPPSSPMYKVIVVKEGLTCQSPMETTYFSGVTQIFDKVCYHCGESDLDEMDEGVMETFKKEYAVVRPICKACTFVGLTPSVRNLNMLKKKPKLFHMPT